jgi:hypothetical protein
MTCKYLNGENIKPSSVAKAEKLIGVHIEYLPERDIDKSGRGFFIPRRGTVDQVHGRNIEISGSWFSFSQIREMIRLEPA